MNGFFRSKAGTAGAILLLLFSLTGVAGPVLVPFQGADAHWRDLSFWQDSPAAAPPMWAGGIEHRTLTGSRPMVESRDGGGTRTTWVFDVPAVSGPAVVEVGGEGATPVVISARETQGTLQEKSRNVVEVTRGHPARIPLVLGPTDRVEVSEYLPPNQEAPPPRLVIVGQVSGLLGTDTAKRDVFTGVVLGIRWALILGLGVSFLTVLTGQKKNAR